MEFLCGYWGLNLGSHTSKTSTLLTGLSPPNSQVTSSLGHRTLTRGSKRMKKRRKDTQKSWNWMEKWQRPQKLSSFSIYNAQGGLINAYSSTRRRDVRRPAWRTATQGGGLAHLGRSSLQREAVCRLILGAERHGGHFLDTLSTSTQGSEGAFPLPRSFPIAIPLSLATLSHGLRHWGP